MKKSRTILTALVVPIAFGGYVAFHPGVAYAGSSLESLAATSIQEAGSYSVDPAHTSIGFEVNHLGISDVQGRFTKKSGKIQVDPKDLTRSSVQFTIETASVDTAVSQRDEHLKSADFFDAAKYPEISFKSTKVRKNGSGYVVDGQLTIKATTKNISIPFKHYGPITDPWGNQRIGVIASPIKINRQDYGVAYNEKLPNGTPSVGNDVTIRIALEATQDKPKS